MEDILRQSKSKIVHIRISKNEKQYLKQLASQSYLSLSGYIRRKLFEDELPNLLDNKIINTKSEFSCDHDKELMKLSLRMYLFIKEISRSTLSENTFKECNALAKKALQEWGYE